MLQGMSAAAARLYSPRRVTWRSYGFPTCGVPSNSSGPAPISVPIGQASARYTRKGRHQHEQFTQGPDEGKTLFALVLALTIFGAVYGFAATLNVGTNQLSAGNATVASCQATAPDRHLRGRVRLDARGLQGRGRHGHGLDAACASKAVSVTLTGAAGANLGTITGAAPAAAARSR